jgi:ABC-type uncharacterized transport system substrate-binding protein
MRNTVRFISAMLVAVAAAAHAQVAAGKKILFIDSYNEGYPWSDGIWKGVQSAVKASGATVEAVHMDTKQHPSEEAKKAAAARVVAEIEKFKPDILIASDDNASKYVIVPTYKDKDIPVVFDGINWDASMYGYPCRNVTGMLEVSALGALVEDLKKYSKGPRVGFLASDNETNRKEVAASDKKFNLALNAAFVTKFADWKQKFVELQETNDILIVDVFEGIQDFNKDEAKAFVQKSTKIITGSTYEDLAEYSALSMAKIPEEQGKYAANTALLVLMGKKISEIPIVANKRFMMIANMKLLRKLGVQPDANLLNSAKIIE